MLQIINAECIEFVWEKGCFCENLPTQVDKIERAPRSQRLTDVTIESLALVAVVDTDLVVGEREREDLVTQLSGET